MRDEEKARTRPQLEAVLAEPNSLVFYRGGSAEVSTAPRKSGRRVSVVAQTSPMREPRNLAPYGVNDVLNELICSDSPDREY